MSKKVLVTGAFGNIGSFALEELLKQGYDVVAFDIDTPINKKNARRFQKEAIQIYWGDISSEQSVNDAMAGIDAVIHLAGIFPPTSEDNKELARKVNIDGTRNIIAAMEKSSTAKRLAFASSIAVYGKEQGKIEPPLNAEHPVSPSDYYGETKAEGERMIRNSSLQWSLLRISASPPVNIKNIGSFIGNSVLEQHPESRIELVHPADAALAFVNAIGCDESIEKTLLLGGGSKNRMTTQQMFGVLLGVFGLKPVPREAFHITDEISFHGDWLDTEESQRLLQFQRSEPEVQYCEFRDSMGPVKYLVPLLKLLSPVIYWIMLLTSPYYAANKRRTNKRSENS